MTAGPNPWADPATPTEAGAPYAGPPATVPPGPFPGPGAYHGSPYGPWSPGWPPYGAGPYPPGPYGPPPPWGPPQPGTRRPGQLIAAAVLAFVQSGLVVLGSLYVLLLASLLSFAQELPGGPADTSGLATEGTVLAVVQLLSAVLLVIGGIQALGGRSVRAHRVLLAGLGLQLLLGCYWAVRVVAVLGDVAGPDPTGAFLPGVLFFVAAPLVALGLALSGPVRRWFQEDEERPAA